jgi:hypothetical protein
VTAATATIMKMMEPIQERILEHLRDYIEDMRDDMQWNESFTHTQDKLAATAQKARAEIVRGLAAPLNPDHL